MYLGFSLNIEMTGSRSSARSPRSDSRHLYARCHLHSNQVPCRFIPGYGNAPGFDILHWIMTRQQWFGVTRLSDLYLPKIASWRFFFLQRSPLHLLNAAAWSGLTPVPENRCRRTIPSSIAQLLSTKF